MASKKIERTFKIAENCCRLKKKIRYLITKRIMGRVYLYICVIPSNKPHTSVAPEACVTLNHVKPFNSNSIICIVSGRCIS
jgi:hypothetical protein